MLYLHWCNGLAGVANILRKTRAVMAERKGDVSYAFARMVGEACAANPGNLSVGVWNVEHDNAPSDDNDAVPTPRWLRDLDSHGDAGCVLVDLSDGGFKPTCVGGYLKTATLRKALK